MNNEEDLAYPENVQLGVEIADAADANDASRAEELIRGGEFIVLQEIDPESGEAVVDDEDRFSVVLAEVEEDMAVVCFSSMSAAESFMEQVCDELTGGTRLPAIVLSGDELLDGLPDGIGLLFNPTTDEECYFSPECFAFQESSGEDDSSSYDE